MNKAGVMGLASKWRIHTTSMDRLTEVRAGTEQVGIITVITDLSLLAWQMKFTVIKNIFDG